MQIDPYLLPYTKLKSKWINDLIMNLVTMNLTEEKVGNSLDCIDIGDNFMNKTPTERLRLIINKWDLKKLKSFCKA